MGSNEADTLIRVGQGAARRGWALAESMKKKKKAHGLVKRTMDDDDESSGPKR